ncbi:hypothetical protein HOK68_02970 [Candidatus Woesearchaeota archaeon]|nr:hypothetical protein [Candidatus Woesearchaeota archaeon]MBT4387875.1 hypothetical protein [Candidatus Woesearchaeota archaeon]MBT4595694.1 hypothetical protein [Candidatus Woesearchaeota archaeon]MBT5741457.1 hypothetical protein [Candidatus Woesearchaeota archaeon]MBT6505715.1 hypothetical protein [Candidatus Woesearchaeota archaeon]
MKTIIKGEGKPIIGIIGALHGDEIIGVNVIEQLKDLKLNKGTIKYIIANQEAIIKNTRCIDQDLNRSFPGEKNGNNEQNLAYQIMDLIKDCDYIIDIHSTDSLIESFIVLTKDNKFIRDELENVLLNKVVIMGFKGKEKSLIEHSKFGFSLEFNKSVDENQVTEIVKNYLKYLNIIDGKSKTMSKEYYYVYEKLSNYNGKLNNFELVNVNGEEFYPILANEKNYEFNCFKAKKLN